MEYAAYFYAGCSIAVIFENGFHCVSVCGIEIVKKGEDGQNELK